MARILLNNQVSGAAKTLYTKASCFYKIKKIRREYKTIYMATDGNGKYKTYGD